MMNLIQYTLAVMAFLVAVVALLRSRSGSPTSQQAAPPRMTAHGLADPITYVPGSALPAGAAWYGENDRAEGAREFFRPPPIFPAAFWKSPS